MSLVGNLGDLSLGDLLQIVSLSQKSGVLVLESGEGSGHIVFCAGQVHAAGIKGQTSDLRGLLIAAGLLDAGRFEAAQAVIGSQAALQPERLAEQAGLEPAAVEQVVRRGVESAIFAMFAWQTGEFSFDARREADIDEGSARLQTGLNAQYLAMEGMRLRDEAARASVPRHDGIATPTAPRSEPDGDLFFGAEPLEIEGGDEIELEADFAVPSPARQRSKPVPVPVAAPAEAVAVAPPAPVAAAPPAQIQRPLVVIEPDAGALEWIKTTVAPEFARIHAFQRADQGLARIRQYLIRGEVPIVLISLATPIDPLSGIHGLPDFAKRLRIQAPRILVVGLREADQERPEAAVPAQLDAVLIRPTRVQLRPAAGVDLAALAERFSADLVAKLAAVAAPPAV